MRARAAVLCVLVGCSTPKAAPAGCDGPCTVDAAPDATRTACELGLEDEALDAWGLPFDRQTRAPSALADAAATCAAFGGRLPSATELYRSRAAIGDPTPLWTSTPDTHTDQVTVRVSDGSASTAPTTSPQAFRCVCADPPASFSTAQCSGPVREPCFAPGTGRFAVDNDDRPALHKGAAIAECAAVHGELAPLGSLVEVLRLGVVGSGTPVQIADQARYDQTSTITWRAAAWQASGQLSVADDETPLPFRCTGWTFPTELPQLDSHDRGAASWVDSHTLCTGSGGHLPTSAELATALARGLPNGTGAALWTSDQAGLPAGTPPTETLVNAIYWVGVDPRHGYRFDRTGMLSYGITWVYKTPAPLAFRCIDYPVDPTFVAPTACQGGCFPTVFGGTPARAYFDTLDRPASTLGDAIETCRAAGGHLTSERDLTEAIRAGLPGTAATFLLTTETAQGYLQVVISPWTTGYDDLYATGHMTVVGATASYPFRCTWTNELR